MSSPLEIAAVAFALVYLVLAIRQSIWCWPAAMISTGLYIFIMYDAGLYMESGLQVFYIAIAVYGWWQWSAREPTGEPERARGAVSPARTETEAFISSDARLRVSTWPWNRHLLATGGVVTAAAISGILLSRYTDAALPYVDSFTTWGAFIATWMVARKILENWLYWFVIDSVSVYLYLSRELYLTAGLFCIYLVLIVIGYRAWQRSMLT